MQSSHYNNYTENTKLKIKHRFILPSEAFRTDIKKPHLKKRYVYSMRGIDQLPFILLLYLKTN